MKNNLNITKFMDEFVTFKIPKELYSKAVMLKTAYKFTDDYYFHLTSDENNYIIAVCHKENHENGEIQNLIMNELIEQANRELVFKETKNIREVLFARSMASSVIYTNESANTLDLDVDDDSAMKDWFEK